MFPWHCQANTACNQWGQGVAIVTCSHCSSRSPVAIKDQRRAALIETEDDNHAIIMRPVARQPHDYHFIRRGGQRDIDIIDLVHGMLIADNPRPNAVRAQERVAASELYEAPPVGKRIAPSLSLTACSLQGSIDWHPDALFHYIRV